MRSDIERAIDMERYNQQKQWGRKHDWGHGDCSSDKVANIVKAAVLAEECGEVSRAVLELNDTNLRTELVQVAAVAVAWLECFSEGEQ